MVVSLAFLKSIEIKINKYNSIQTALNKQLSKLKIHISDKKDILESYLKKNVEDVVTFNFKNKYTWWFHLLF